jgi:hypothetical protein
METFKIPFTQKFFTGLQDWRCKAKSVILVKDERDIESLWNLLCEQDEDWLNYKEVIRVAPKVLESELQLHNISVYCGKASIFNVEQLQAKIPFLIYQEPETFEWQW